MHWPPAPTGTIPRSCAHTSSLIPISGRTHAHPCSVCWKDRLKFPQTADVNMTPAMLTWVWNCKQLVTKHPASCQQHKAGQAGAMCSRALSTCVVDIASCSLSSQSLQPRYTVMSAVAFYRAALLSGVSLQCLQSCTTAATGLKNNALSAWARHGWVVSDSRSQRWQLALIWILACQCA